MAVRVRRLALAMAIASAVFFMCCCTGTSSTTLSAFATGPSTHTPGANGVGQHRPVQTQRIVKSIGMHASNNVAIAGILLFCTSAVRLLCTSRITNAGRKCSPARHVVRCTAPASSLVAPTTSAMHTISVPAVVPQLDLSTSAPLLPTHESHALVARAALLLDSELPTLAPPAAAAAAAAATATPRASRFAGARWVGSARSPARRGGRTAARAAALAAGAEREARRAAGAKLLPRPHGEVPVMSYDASTIRAKLQSSLSVPTCVRSFRGRRECQAASCTVGVRMADLSSGSVCIQGNYFILQLSRTQMTSSANKLPLE